MLVLRWILFLAIMGLFAALDEWANETVNHGFAGLTAQTSAWIMRIFGSEAQATGTFLSTSSCTFKIIGECTAYYPCALFVGAVLSFPDRLRRKLLGMALGIPAILILNQVRIISLCYISRHYPAHFETIHLLLWQPLIVFFTLLLWVVWLSTSRHGHVPSSV